MGELIQGASTIPQLLAQDDGEAPLRDQNEEINLADEQIQQFVAARIRSPEDARKFLTRCSHELDHARLKKITSLTIEDIEGGISMNAGKACSDLENLRTEVLADLRYLDMAQDSDVIQNLKEHVIDIFNQSAYRAIDYKGSSIGRRYLTCAQIAYDILSYIYPTYQTGDTQIQKLSYPETSSKDPIKDVYEKLRDPILVSEALLTLSALNVTPAQQREPSFHSVAMDSGYYVQLVQDIAESLSDTVAIGSSPHNYSIAGLQVTFKAAMFRAIFNNIPDRQDLYLMIASHCKDLLKQSAEGRFVQSRNPVISMHER